MYSATKTEEQWRSSMELAKCDNYEPTTQDWVNCQAQKECLSETGKKTWANIEECIKTITNTYNEKINELSTDQENGNYEKLQEIINNIRSSVKSNEDKFQTEIKRIEKCMYNLSMAKTVGGTDLQKIFTPETKCKLFEIALIKAGGNCAWTSAYPECELTSALNTEQDK